MNRPSTLTILTLIASWVWAFWMGITWTRPWDSHTTFALVAGACFIAMVFRKLRLERQHADSLRRWEREAEADAVGPRPGQRL